RSSGGRPWGEITPFGALRGSPDLLAKFFTSSYFPPGYGARAPGFGVWRGDQIPRRGTPVRRRDRALPAGRAGAGQLAAHPPPFPDHGDGARRGARLRERLSRAPGRPAKPAPLARAAPAPPVKRTAAAG